MIKKIFLTAAASILPILGSCNSNPIVPPEDKPGRRDYTWTVDTLNMPMNWVTSVWGSSPQNLWAVGGGGTGYDRLQHYDGIKWSAYTKEWINIGGETLYGFSENDIWMGGSGGWGDGSAAAIWHYNGSKWSKNFIYKVEGARSSADVVDIWGDRPDDIYACGTIGYLIDGKDIWRGFVLYYDGSDWKEVIKADFNSQFVGIRKDIYNINFFPNNAYVFSYEPSYVSSDSDRFAFYQVSDRQLSQIYANIEKNITWASFNVIKGDLYFLIDKDAYLYRNKTFVKQFSVDKPNLWYLITGRNSKDIFLSMSDGLVHYDGTDFQYLYYFHVPYIHILSSILFEKDVFFGMIYGDKNLILHGKLKE